MQPPIHRFKHTTDDGLMVEAQRLNSDHVLCRMGLHGHLFFELLLIESGSGIHRHGAVCTGVAPGDLFVIAPGDLHDCTALGDAEGWVLLLTQEAVEGHSRSLGFSRQWMPKHPLLLPFLRRAGQDAEPVRLKPTALAAWCGRLAAIEAEAKDRRVGRLYAIHAELNLILVDLMREIGPQVPVEVAEEPILTAVFDFIETEFARPIGLRDVAQHVGRSPPYLTTLLRRRTGQTVGQWIVERRMAEARRLLVQSDLVVVRIAQEVGYDDPSAFGRSFARRHGLAPNAWRVANRHQPAYRSTS